MKRILLCLGMGGALFSATLNAQNYPSLGKIEHFKFDNSLAGDLGGSIGGVTPTYVADRFGVPNKAQRFTEGTSNVVIQNFPTGTNSRTISFWFKGNTDIVQELFNVKGSTSGEMQISYQFPDANANSNIITVSNGNSSSNVKARLSYSNEWKQVTVVNLSGSHRIYINGVHYATGSNSSNIAGTPVFRIGMSNTDVVSADFDMDDLIVYNRALSDLEILQVFTAPVNAPLQEWTLFQNGPGGRIFNSLEYLKRTNPGTSNQVIFSSGYTGHSGTTTVVTSNSEPRVMHETAFVTSANNTNLQVYGTDYTMDANTTLTNANNFQDEAFTCGASWVLYYNTNNTSNRSGYWIGKIHRRIASPNATVAFNEVYSQAGRPLSDIESNKKFNGINVIAVGKTAPTSFANGGNSFQESPVILSSINGGTNWQEIDLTSLNLGSAGLRSIKWLNQTTAIVVGYKKIVGVGFEPPTFLPLILKTTDAGLSWVDVTPNNAGLEALNLVQFSNNQLWVAGDNGKLLKSTDDGSTWTMIATDVFSSVTNIYFQDAQNGIVAGTGSYVAKTTNGGQTWRRLYFQDPARITGLEFKDATNGLIQTTAGTLYQYTPCVTLTNTINATACGSYTSPSGNQTWTSSGQYTETLTSSTGCDSIVTVNLTVISSFATTQTASACSSFTWIDGVTYTSSTNTPTQLLQSVNGCDSLVTLNLTIYNPNPATHTVSACASFTWVDGITYTSNNNTATFLLQTVNGCDSLVTLNLTIQNNTGVATQTACESFTWIDNVTYTASTNTPTFTLTNAAGCDSVVTLNLTIYNNQTGTANVTACGSYTWIDGNTYTTNNNTATHLLQSVNGCDSLVTLNLTFGTENTGTATISACDSYTWIDGNTYTSSTMTPTFTLTNQSGCDSLVTLNLTIKNSSSSVDVITSCDPVQWINGMTYSSSTNTPTFVVPNAVGCDSVITLNLTINSVTPTITLNGSTLTTTATGGTYQWVDCANNNAAIAGATSQSFTPTMTGNYAVQYTINGCTKISNCITVTLANIENLEAINWAIYPNPASETVYFRNVNTGSQIRVLDLSGKLIYVSKFDASNNTISVANWNNGMYIVEIEYEGLINQTKLVINK
jgi:photosystem II stability/assembly factor-like uncharacterized protein